MGLSRTLTRDHVTHKLIARRMFRLFGGDYLDVVDIVKFISKEVCAAKSLGDITIPQQLNKKCFVYSSALDIQDNSHYTYKSGEPDNTGDIFYRIGEKNVTYFFGF